MNNKDNTNQIFTNIKKPNLNNFNYNDQSQIKEADNYLKYLLNQKSSLKKMDIKWLVEYLIKKEGNELGVTSKVNSLTFIEHVNKCILNKSLSLNKIAKYFSMSGNCMRDEGFNGLIQIHTDLVSFDHMLYSYPIAIYNLLETCFHELEHAKQNKKRSENGSGFHMTTLSQYEDWKERFIIILDNDYYLSHHDEFKFEIEANIAGADKAMKVLKQCAPNLYKASENYAVRNINSKINSNILSHSSILNNAIDAIVKKNPALVQLNGILNLEYKADGSIKNLIEILNQKERYWGITYELHNFMIINSLNRMNLNSFGEILKNLATDNINRLQQSIEWEIKNISDCKKRDDVALEEKYINLLQWYDNENIIAEKFKRMGKYQRMINTLEIPVKQI